MGNIGSITGRRDACTHVTRDIAGNGSAEEELRPEESRTNGDDEEYSSRPRATIRAPGPFPSYSTIVNAA